MQHSRRGTHRRARPSGFWPSWAWAGAPGGREPGGQAPGGRERTLASGESLKDALTLMNMPLETPNLSAFLSARSFCGWRHAHAA